MTEEHKDGDDEVSGMSALRDNISRKGQNSYYYGHATQRNGPAWDGKEEPRLLSVEEVAASPRLALAFDSYSWGDEKKSIKIYIDFDAASVSDDKISLDFTPNSVTFKLNDVNGGKDYKLSLAPLTNDITDATFKKKDTMFVLTLKKEAEVTWTALSKK